jgi:hypothetical protein
MTGGASGTGGTTASDAGVTPVNKPWCTEQLGSAQYCGDIDPTNQLRFAWKSKDGYHCSICFLHATKRQEAGCLISGPGKGDTTFEFPDPDQPVLCVNNCSECQ